MRDSDHWVKTGGISLPKRLLITLTYLVQVTIAYGLMLAVMSFNVGAFFATCGGLTMGNFLTSYWKLRQEIDDFNENQGLDDAKYMRNNRIKESKSEHFKNNALKR